MSDMIQAWENNSRSVLDVLHRDDPSPPDPAIEAMLKAARESDTEWVAYEQRHKDLMAVLSSLTWENCRDSSV